MLSNDQKLLFAAIKGDKKTDDALVVVDLEKGTSISHVLSDHPTRLFRLGSKHEPWILGNEEMQALSESGELTGRQIQLNSNIKFEDSGDRISLIHGVPSAFKIKPSIGENIDLGEDRIAVLIKGNEDLYDHNVVLIDLKKLQVDAIISTMSSHAASKLSGRMLGNQIFGISTPSNAFSNRSLATRPDGRFLYALDVDANEVTVVDVQTATIAKRIPVNNTVTKLQVSTDGKHLNCFGKKTQQINLETNNLEN